MKSGAFEHDHADDADEVGDGIDDVDVLRPLRHAFDGGEQSAHQDENDHEKPTDKHGLLHGVGQSGNDKTDAEDGDHVNGGHAKDERDAAHQRNVEKQPGHEQADGQFEHGDDPEGEELAGDELVFADGGDVELLDGADFFFLDDVHSGEEQPDHGNQQHDDAGNHVGFVIELGVEPIGILYPDGLLCMQTGHFGDDVEVVILDDGGGVGVDEACGGVVDGVDGEADFGFLLTGEVAAEVCRNLYDEVGTALVHGLFAGIEVGGIADDGVKR